ncbi:nucleotide exchange factor GrpE [Streptomonospora sp. PA3]|uniref:nucleotide exchange factor GrpE n=1 Tax=Streptomonospora sp. PA3 TaxID=2607326 RepID=UPI0012DC40AD|nr:nucleotide exchange factor GrpE [Streptomonospora sp. PA3]MUL40382.1 nucleotide exchange factor GrpE [Streptomonospora sp. PA3]
MALPENENGEEQQGPVIRDKRRIDPETGELRTPEGAADAAPDSPEAEVAADEEPVVVDDTAAGGELLKAREQIAELTNDLKRIQAEYANYRKRVERDRVALREQATAQVVGDLLPILDDIGRAREHDELTGGFKSVGEALEALVNKLGLRKYGETGDEFDPNVHEALTMVPSPDAVPTVVEVFQPGYTIGERVLRPARVVVAGPGDDAAEAPESAEPAESAPEPGGQDTSGEESGPDASGGAAEDKQ